MQTRGHQKIARALGRGGRQNRRLELEEAFLLHARAKAVDDAPAQHDIGVQFFAAQIDEAVFEAGFLGVGLVAEHGHRQFGGGAEHLDLAHIDLDQPGRHFGVFGAGGAMLDLAVEPHDPFRAQRLRRLERRRVGIDHALHEAIMVAQIDEQHAAVIANAVAPAGETDFLADMAVAEFSAVVRTVAMHFAVFLLKEKAGRMLRPGRWRGKAHGRGASVKTGGSPF